MEDFDLNGENFTAIVNLEPGNNVLTLSAQNEDGKAEASIQVLIPIIAAEKPVSLAPSVIFTQPSESGTVITEKTFKFVANIRNVSAREEIKLWVNGDSVADFEFNVRARQILIQPNLKEGRNTIKIEAKNAIGSTAAETFFIFQEKRNIEEGKNPLKILLNN